MGLGSVSIQGQFFLMMPFLKRVLRAEFSIDQVQHHPLQPSLGVDFEGQFVSFLVQ